MKKNTARLIVIAVLIMILLNAALVSLLWSNDETATSQRTQVTEVNDYIIEEMGFDEAAADQFRKIAAQHHENQIQIQGRYREIKRKLNLAMISQNQQEAELLLEQLLKAVREKENELYRFFAEVMKITSEEQKLKFGKIFRDATGAPDYERVPMKGKEDHPPHPKR